MEVEFFLFGLFKGIGFIFLFLEVAVLDKWWLFVE